MLRDNSLKPFRNQKRIVVGVTYDLDALNYISAAGYTNEPLKLSINDTFLELKAKNYYQHIVKWHPMITDKTLNADMLNQFKWNAINPVDSNAAYRLTFFGSPTVDKNGFLVNGTSQYAETYFNYATYFGVSNQDVGMMTFYLEPTLAATGVIESNSTFRSNQTILNNGSSTNGCIGREAGTVSTRPSANGGFAVKASSGNVQKIFYREVLDNTSTPTFRGQPTGTEHIGRRNGSVILYSTSGVAQHLTFKTLNDSEIIDLMNILNRLNGSIDTIFGTTRKKY